MLQHCFQRTCRCRRGRHASGCVGVLPQLAGERWAGKKLVPEHVRLAALWQVHEGIVACHISAQSEACKLYVYSRAQAAESVRVSVSLQP